MLETEIRTFTKDHKCHPGLQELKIFGRAGHRYLRIKSCLGEFRITYTLFKVKDNVTMNDVTIEKVVFGWDHYYRCIRDGAVIQFRIKEREYTINPEYEGYGDDIVTKFYKESNKNNYSFNIKEKLFKLAYLYDDIKKEMDILELDDEAAAKIILKNHRLIEILALSTESKELTIQSCASDMILVGKDTLQLVNVIDNNNLEIKKLTETFISLSQENATTQKFLSNATETIIDLKKNQISLQSRIDELEKEKTDYKQNVMTSVKKALDLMKDL